MTTTTMQNLWSNQLELWQKREKESETESNFKRGLMKSSHQQESTEGSYEEQVKDVYLTPCV